jgi:NifB/MoaA-like Fe-S oxidoreductase
LTGQDVIRQLKPRLQPGDQILIPSCMLKADSPVFLDDITLEALANELAVPVYAVRADAEGLAAALTGYMQKGVHLYEQTDCSDRRPAQCRQIDPVQLSGR